MSNKIGKGSLIAYANDTLDEPTRAQVEVALCESVTLRAELATIRRLQRDLRTMLAAEGSPVRQMDVTWDRIAQQIDGHTPVQVPPPPELVPSLSVSQPLPFWPHLGMKIAQLWSGLFTSMAGWASLSTWQAVGIGLVSFFLTPLLFLLFVTWQSQISVNPFLSYPSALIFISPANTEFGPASSGFGPAVSACSTCALAPAGGVVPQSRTTPPLTCAVPLEIVLRRQIDRTNAAWVVARAQANMAPLEKVATGAWLNRQRVYIDRLQEEGRTERWRLIGVDYKDVALASTSATVGTVEQWDVTVIDASSGRAINDKTLTVIQHYTLVPQSDQWIVSNLDLSMTKKYGSCPQSSISLSMPERPSTDFSHPSSPFIQQGVIPDLRSEEYSE